MSDRILRDEILTSERYWAVSNEAKLLYIHLILNVDDTARFSGKNFTLRASCFQGQAMEACHMERMLEELLAQDLIRLYTVASERYIFLPRFKQRLRFTNSKFPAPPNEINDLVIKKSDLSQTQVSPESDSSQQKLREVKRREEEICVDQQPAKEKKSSGSAKGTRLPQDWKLPDEWMLWAKKERPDLNPHQIADQFRDYWLGIAGTKGVKLDWYATWRNWVRNQRGNQTPYGGKSSFEEYIV